jgi:hypothetical protein
MAGREKEIKMKVRKGTKSLSIYTDNGEVLIKCYTYCYDAWLIVEAVPGFIKNPYTVCCECRGEHPHGLAHGPACKKTFYADSHKDSEGKTNIDFFNYERIREVLIREINIDPDTLERYEEEVK